MQTASMSGSAAADGVARPNRWHDLKSFLLASCIFVSGNVLVVAALCVLGVVDESTPTGSLPSTFLKAFWWAVVFAPLFETVILYLSLALSRRLLKAPAVVATLGALPLALLHGFVGWEKIVVVTAGLVWSGACYLRLTAQGRRPRFKYAFLTGMHALNNAFVVLVSFSSLRGWF